LPGRWNWPANRSVSPGKHAVLTLVPGSRGQEGKRARGTPLPTDFSFPSSAWERRPQSSAWRPASYASARSPRSRASRRTFPSRAWEREAALANRRRQSPVRPESAAPTRGSQQSTTWT